MTGWADTLGFEEPPCGEVPGWSFGLTYVPDFQLKKPTT